MLGWKEVDRGKTEALPPAFTLDHVAGNRILSAEQPVGCPDVAQEQEFADPRARYGSFIPDFSHDLDPEKTAGKRFQELRISFPHVAEVEIFTDDNGRRFDLTGDQGDKILRGGPGKFLSEFEVIHKINTELAE